MRRKFRIFLILLWGTILMCIVNYFGLHYLDQDVKIVYSATPSPWLFYRLDFNSSETINNSWENKHPEDHVNCAYSELSYFPKKFHYRVFRNFLAGEHVASCNDQLITYTTHGDYRYLDNLLPIVQRWRAPISMALYVPYKDLYESLYRIHYLRECTSHLVRKWITFHLFAENKYFQENPEELWKHITAKAANKTQLCHNIPEFSEELITSRMKSKLLYPVNYARNLARREAFTYFVLASDIELYPSPSFIPSFFSMLHQNQHLQYRKDPYVFVLPIFEIEEGYQLPNNRKELLEYLYSNISMTFHKYVCEDCHKVPRYEQWLSQSVQENKLSIFHIAKRNVLFRMWEPIFVSTNSIPFYDERLTWEGLRDKMTHSYVLCLLNFDFMILDNAFLVHRPGIKRKKHNWDKPSFTIRRQMRLIDKSLAEIGRKYGSREDCKFG